MNASAVCLSVTGWQHPKRRIIRETVLNWSEVFQGRVWALLQRGTVQAHLHLAGHVKMARVLLFVPLLPSSSGCQTPLATLPSCPRSWLVLVSTTSSRRSSAGTSPTSSRYKTNSRGFPISMCITHNSVRTLCKPLPYMPLHPVHKGSLVHKIVHCLN